VRCGQLWPPFRALSARGGRFGEWRVPASGRVPVRWSVGIETEGDRVLSREEVVELADAVATSSGIATGIGTNRYGAQLLVEAGTRDEAVEKAKAEFARAVATAGLPVYPIVRVEAVGEDEDEVGEGLAGEGSAGERSAGEYEGSGG
jgi:hypothetical protein